MRVGSHVSLELLDEMNVAIEPYLEDEAVGRVEAERIWSAFLTARADLSPTQNVAITGNLLGLTSAQTALLMGCSKSAVTNAISSARQRLHNHHLMRQVLDLA